MDPVVRATKTFAVFRVRVIFVNTLRSVVMLKATLYIAGTQEALAEYITYLCD